MESKAVFFLCVAKPPEKERFFYAPKDFDTKHTLGTPKKKAF